MLAVVEVLTFVGAAVLPSVLAATWRSSWGSFADKNSLIATKKRNGRRKTDWGDWQWGGRYTDKEGGWHRLFVWKTFHKEIGRGHLHKQK